jgi:hypothetical protein
VFFRSQIIEPKSRYEYDALYRLTYATGRESRALTGVPTNEETPPIQVNFPIDDPNALRTYEQFYTYDEVGNFARMRHVADGGSWTRSYSPAGDSNRLERTAVGPTSTEYGFDTHGNMLNLANKPDEYSLHWDCRYWSRWRRACPPSI